MDMDMDMDISNSLNSSLVCLLGKKYDDFLRKNTNIRGKRCKNGGNEEIFCTLGNNMIFEKGGGQKYQLFE